MKCRSPGRPWGPKRRPLRLAPVRDPLPMVLIPSRSIPRRGARGVEWLDPAARGSVDPGLGRGDCPIVAWEDGW